MDEETFYTIPEAAEKLRVTRAALYKWMKQGRLAYVVVGSERRITGSAVDAFVKSGGLKKPDGDSGAKIDTQISASGHGAVVLATP